MTEQEKQKKKSIQQGGRGAHSRQAPKIKVMEAGESEQGEAAAGQPITERLTPEEVARQKQHDAYRHGGIPLGSDPRE